LNLPDGHESGGLSPRIARAIVINKLSLALRQTQVVLSAAEGIGTQSAFKAGGAYIALPYGRAMLAFMG
jgi:hypothetical protein